MSDQNRSSRRRSITVPVVVAVVAALLAGIALLASRGGDTSGQEAAGRPVKDVSRDQPAPREALGSPDPLAALVRRTPGDPMALGDVNAPVVMIAYSEFQCPFCGKFARDTEPALVKKYVDNGTLRIEWRDFPYLGPESLTAAHAGRAAAAQGKFWQFHDALYAHQQPVNGGRLTQTYLADVAKGLGLDVAKFRADMNSAATSRAVQHDFTEGQSIGVTGTPAFLVNGRPIMGAQPLPVFEQAIEQAAAAAR